MKEGRWSVLVTASAECQLVAINRWWEDRRPAAPDLFRQELSRAFARLATVPATGAVFESAAVPGSRRILLPRSRYHLYYTMHADRGEVLVRAVWHASRGQRPKLG